MSKIPVFDIGDTLMPSFRLQNKLMKDELKEQGAEEIPEFDVNNFRIYTPSEVKEYLDKHGLDHGDPMRIIEKYKDRERRYMEEKGVFETLRQISEDFGSIGFVSDNTIEGKRWMADQLEAHNVPYEGLVVSEEVGVEKPDPKIFKEFLNIRGRPGKDFVYFGNNLNRDPACQKVGMDFVLVKQYKVYGEKDVDPIDKISYRAVKEAVE
ncbi:MAG: putative hydrolase of the HAD superfamily [Candidatus Nanohaloarchaea archaeon]|jgi:putative hydrolase of the HAD superfamily